MPKYEVWSVKVSRKDTTDIPVRNVDDYNIEKVKMLRTTNTTDAAAEIFNEQSHNSREHYYKVEEEEPVTPPASE